MTTLAKRLFASSMALLAAATLSVGLSGAPAAASEIKYVVNNIAVTSYDIQRRAAFLKLQRRSSKEATKEMIDQALREAEIKRLGIKVTDQQVDQAYAQFAASNKLQPKQMDEILNQTGVTKSHFKAFIRSQIGWGQALGAKMRNGSLSEQDVVQKMLQQGGNKPSATEYMLQQVIFVVPAAERKSTLGKRKKEADAMRQRFSGCDTTREFAKGLLDVTVRDLGRVLAPELPPEWADQIKKAKAGSATGIKETERGVEFIGICSAREVSDDRVAQLVFQSEIGKSGEGDDVSKSYTEELRKEARIVER